MQEDLQDVAIVRVLYPNEMTVIVRSAFNTTKRDTNRLKDNY